MVISIRGLVGLPSAGLVIAEVMVKFQTPTLVTTNIGPPPPFKSPPPLSVKLMRGFTPSEIDKVAVACAQLAKPTTASPTIKVLRPCFINASPLPLFELLTLSQASHRIYLLAI